MNLDFLDIYYKERLYLLSLHLIQKNRYVICDLFIYYIFYYENDFWAVDFLDKHFCTPNVPYNVYILN